MRSSGRESSHSSIGEAGSQAAACSRPSCNGKKKQDIIYYLPPFAECGSHPSQLHTPYPELVPYDAKHKLHAALSDMLEDLKKCIVLEGKVLGLFYYEQQEKKEQFACFSAWHHYQVMMLPSFEGKIHGWAARKMENLCLLLKKEAALGSCSLQRWEIESCFPDSLHDEKERQSHVRDALLKVSGRYCAELQSKLEIFEKNIQEKAIIVLRSVYYRNARLPHNGHVFVHPIKDSRAARRSLPSDIRVICELVAELTLTMQHARNVVYRRMQDWSGTEYGQRFPVETCILVCNLMLEECEPAALRVGNELFKRVLSDFMVCL